MPLKRFRDPRIHLQNRLVPALALLLLAIQWIAPYDGWLILLTGLSAAWLGSYLWARALAHGLELRREVRYGWAQVGDRLEERFTLINRSPVPALWVEVVDQTTMPDYQVSRATGVNGLSSIRWVTQGVLQPARFIPAGADQPANCRPPGYLHRPTREPALGRNHGDAPDRAAAAHPGGPGGALR